MVTESYNLRQVCLPGRVLLCSTMFGPNVAFKIVLKDKGPEWNPLLFAHPSTLNNGKPFGYRDASLDVCDEATPSITHI